MIENRACSSGRSVGGPCRRQVKQDLRLARREASRAIEDAHGLAMLSLSHEQPTPAVEDRRVAGSELARVREPLLGIGESTIRIGEHVAGEV